MQCFAQRFNHGLNYGLKHALDDGLTRLTRAIGLHSRRALAFGLGLLLLSLQWTFLVLPPQLGFLGLRHLDATGW